MKKILFVLSAIITLISCGKSTKQQERERNLQMLDNYINHQVESGMGQRYHNLDEMNEALQRQQQVQRQQYQYRQVTCPSCNGDGKYYDYSIGKWFTCPTCAGNGVVLQYNN